LLDRNRFFSFKILLDLIKLVSKNLRSIFRRHSRKEEGQKLILQEDQAGIDWLSQEEECLVLSVVESPHVILVLNVHCLRKYSEEALTESHPLLQSFGVIMNGIKCEEPLGK
jgi:hypothetical protein